jgi:pyruvate dehydrogenase E1 component alpha subunit
MDFFSCYGGFAHAFDEVLKDQKPILIEVITQRFKGHSISDPGLYRSKEELTECMKKDPLILFSHFLINEKLLTEEEYQQIDKEQKELVLEALKFADESPWPNPITLGEDVLAT